MWPRNAELYSSSVKSMKIEVNAAKRLAQCSAFVGSSVEPIDISIGITDAQAMKIAGNVGFSGSLVKDAAEEIKRLYKLFLAVDATQIEINPFVETEDGR
ncbi:ATP-grasp domain protein, partial [Cooperia oncophora]